MDNRNKNSIQKSITHIKTKVKKVKKSISEMSVKRKIAAISGAAIIFALGATTGAVGKGIIDNVSEVIEINEVANNLKDEYQGLVAESTHSLGVNKNSEPVFWYDTDYMAEKVSELEDDFDMEKALLGISKNIRVSKKDTLDDILWKLSHKVDEKSYFSTLSIPNSLEKFCNDKGIDIQVAGDFEKYIYEQNKLSGGIKK